MQSGGRAESIPTTQYLQLMSKIFGSQILYPFTLKSLIKIAHP